MSIDDREGNRHLSESSEAQLIRQAVGCSLKLAANSLSSRRSRRMIELEILSRSLEPIIKTQLRYGAGLDNRMMNRYLRRLLMEGSLIKEGRFYRVSERGLEKAAEILRGYRSLYALVQTQARREMRR